MSSIERSRKGTNRVNNKEKKPSRVTMETGGEGDLKTGVQSDNQPTNDENSRERETSGMASRR